jgi:hypothetical protein
MRRILGVLVLVAVVGACGGGGTPQGGGEQSSGAGGAAAGGAAAGGVNPNVPPGSSVYFGTGYDPSTFAVTGKTTNAKAGTPIVAVGKSLAPTDGSGVKLQLSLNGSAKPARAPDAMDNPSSASFFASDLSKDNLTPGTWIVSFTNTEGRIVASGFLTVSP